MAKAVEDANTYRVGHPLAQRLLERGRGLALHPADVRFEYSGSEKSIAALEPLLGQRGWVQCARFSLRALETEEMIIFSGLTDAGDPMTEAQCRRLFDLPGAQGARCDVPSSVATALDQSQARRRGVLLEETATRNGLWFDTEMDKLDRWAEDRRASLKADLEELDDSLREAKKAARLAPTLPEKLELQRAVRTLETKRDEAWRGYDQASREIDRQKDALLDEISRRLEQRIQHEPLFTLRWELG